MEKSNLSDKHLLKQLLSKQCTPVVQRVFDDMRTNKIFSVKEIQNGAKIPVSKEAVLYRWWFPEDSVVLEKLLKNSREDDALKNLLEEVERRTDIGDGQPYRALYFGKSSNGYHRFYQHIKGTVRISTVRHTVYGLCIPNEYNADKEPEINKILSRCYCEWTDLGDDSNLVGCFEEICIALGKYPLNVDGNPAISENWRNKLLEGRKISKKKKVIRQAE